MIINDSITLSPEVQHAFEAGKPIVALESAVITHGLPHPVNQQMAFTVEKIIRQSGVTPATIAFLNGRLHIGLTSEEIELLSSSGNLHKISARNFSLATFAKWSGGTTVAGTLLAAHLAGIKVFSTGGIGGVHRDHPHDISADLLELSRNPLIVVCSGAKAILDLPATLEILESYGIPIIGFKTDEFSAFYSSHSGLPVDMRIDKADQIARLARLHWQLKLSSAILVSNPVPQEFDLPVVDVERSIQHALKKAKEQGISGAEVTPFLLDNIRISTGGKSMQTNLALLENNAALAASLALALHHQSQKR